MSSLAKELNSEQITAALKYIDEYKPSLNWSKWKLHYEGKQYPPKEVVRIAARLAEIPNWEEKRLNGGDKTNGPLQALGFEIKSTTADDLLQELVDRYKSQFREQKGLGDERYKWELIAKYGGRPHLDEEDLLQEIKGIEYRNLIYSTGIAVIHHLAKDQTRGYRQALTDLFASESPLSERIDAFIETVSQLYGVISPNPKFNHYHDERTIATILTFHDPDNYVFYKYSFYSKLCKLINTPPAPKNRKYIHYLELIESFIEDYVIPDTDFIDVYRACLTDDLYQDSDLKLLAQDILYRSLDQQTGLDRAYWRIGTGDDEGNYWEQMLTAGVVGIGWPDLGDLEAKSLSSKSDVLELLKETGHYLDPKSKATATRKAGEIFNFLSAIKVGDVVVGQDGKNICGIGVVTSEYEYRRSMNFPHTRNVNWMPRDIGFVNKDGLLTSVWQISDLNTIKNIDQFLNEADQSNADSLKKDKMNFPLNQILYGPPGTGKTYHTINKALSIIEDKPEEELEKEERNELLNRFNNYRQTGQIVFTTFHQSMSYEDFIEGIKPDTDGYGNISYDVRSGIFKEICLAAQTPNQTSFDEAFRRLQENLKAKERITLKTPRKNKYDIALNSKGNLTLYTGSSFNNSQGTLTKENVQKYINKEPSWQGWEGYFAGVVEYLTDICGYAPTDSDGEPSRYVLIIDEINRGNVSQIFGELITLLEESKREQGEEPLTVTLPYSQKPFSVPSNLYIIGTMNTADRSVEALDAALRRRFSFTEMLPNASLIAKKGKLKDGILDEDPNYTINLSKLLETINLRIEKLVDRDHQIGHSYFLPVKDWETLRQAFYECLIPLLQEYFFGDYGKIALVLGRGFVEPKENPKPETTFFADVPEGYEDLGERKVYEIKMYNADEIDGFKEAVQKIKIIAGANE